VDHIGVNAVQANRAIHLLMGLTGNLDVPGGNCYWPGPKLADTERWNSLSDKQATKRLGADRFLALTERPTAYAHPPTVFKAMLTGDPYPVKALLVIGNNPAVCYPNTTEVVEALRCLDLLVVSEIFMTPTVELADVVLPAASNLERDDPRLYMHIKGPEGTLIDTATKHAGEPVGKRRSDWDFLVDLGVALGLTDAFSTVEAFVAEALEPTGYTWDDLREMDFAIEPMRYRKYEEDGFGTPTGKFELWSTQFESWGYDPLPSHREPHYSPVRTPELAHTYPLILNTGVRQPMYWNSNGHPLESLRKLQPEPSMEVHPETAADFGLEEGGYGWVETPDGSLRLKVRCNPRTSEGVISVPHGWWRPEDDGPDHGLFSVCANVLTDSDMDHCDPILGSSPLKALLCSVRPASQAHRTEAAS
jgi:anaerobic selenocysteine-containing dehydrogenase